MPASAPAQDDSQPTQRGVISVRLSLTHLVYNLLRSANSVVNPLAGYSSRDPQSRCLDKPGAEIGIADHDRHPAQFAHSELAKRNRMLLGAENSQRLTGKPASEFCPEFNIPVTLSNGETGVTLSNTYSLYPRHLRLGISRKPIPVLYMVLRIRHLLIWSYGAATLLQMQYFLFLAPAMFGLFNVSGA